MGWQLTRSMLETQNISQDPISCKAAFWGLEVTNFEHGFVTKSKTRKIHYNPLVYQHFLVNIHQNAHDAWIYPVSEQMALSENGGHPSKIAVSWEKN